MQTRLFVLLSGILVAVPTFGCTPKTGSNDAGARPGTGGSSPPGGRGGQSAAGGAGGGSGGTSGSSSGGQTGGGGSGAGGTTGGGGSGSSASGGAGGSGGAAGGSGGMMAANTGGVGGGNNDAGATNGDVADTRGRTVPDAYIYDGLLPSYPPLEACAQPSIDHLRQFTAWSGTTAPPTGSNILTKEGNDTVAKISLINCATWCQLVVPIANSLSAQVDLTKSAGFTMRYSAAAPLFVQVRPASRYDGGDKWIIQIPATGNKVEEHFFPFIPDAWFYLNRLGVPTYPFTTALKDARSFVFVTNVTNELTIRG
ncbi:MAG TPA: hypothetical protein VGF45_00510, partial [Polyangia bacterium]